MLKSFTVELLRLAAIVDPRDYYILQPYANCERG